MASSRRPKLKTKEELIDYLVSNPETELPFNEEVWNRAVEATKNKERKNKVLQTEEFDGSVTKKVIPNGTIHPVGKYFQMMALPQYARPAVDLDDEDLEGGTGEDTVSSFVGYRPQEKKFLNERLSEYYDNYEINTGSDKFIVRQIVVYELELQRLNGKMAAGKDVYSAIEKVTKQYLALCESLKALKKQRGAMDEGKNKFTQFMDALEKEGEFRPTFEMVVDGIGHMLTCFEESVVRVFHEG